MRLVSSPTPRARRITRASWPLLAVLGALGCPKSGGGSGVTPAVASCDFPTGLTSAASSALRSCASASRTLVDTRHGTGDGQRLAVMGSGRTLVYGPYAEIAPLRGFAGAASVTDVSDWQLGRGVPMALITAKGPYPKLGIQPGENVLIVHVEPGAAYGHAAMVSIDSGTVTLLRVTVEEHKDAKDQPLATARWLWSDTDETAWVACGRKCCWVTARE